MLLAPALAGAGCDQAPVGAGGEVGARLVSVTDGDTIRARVGGREERIRYIGIDTPEIGEPCFERATAENARLLGSGPLRLEYDRDRRDRYGRLLAYVYAGDVFVNAELVSRGYASHIVVAPNDRHADELARLERESDGANPPCPL